MSIFTQKTVLVTGASSGIGKAFAYQLAQKGANLIITARSEETLISIQKDIETRYGVQVSVIVADLTQSDASEKIYEEVLQKNLSVDILINNAGFGKWVPFLSQKNEVYRDMVQLNITSLVSLTQLFLPSMVAKNTGGIIHVASTASFFPCPYISVYAATKAFVLSFSEALSGEYSDTGLTIMALCPGNTQTGFQKAAQVDLKGEPSESADQVVKNALKAYENKKTFVVSGFLNKILTELPRFFPRSLIIKIVKKTTEKPLKNI